MLISVLLVAQCFAVDATVDIVNFIVHGSSEGST